jgi:hypothetical protein
MCSLDQLLHSNRKLTLQLMSFIEKLKGYPMNIEHPSEPSDHRPLSVIPQPTQHIAFLGKEVKLYYYT